MERVEINFLEEKYDKCPMCDAFVLNCVIITNY